MSKSDFKPYLSMARDLALEVPEAISRFAQYPQEPQPAKEVVTVFLSALIKTAANKLDQEWRAQKTKSPFRAESVTSQRRWAKTSRNLIQVEGTRVHSFNLDSNEVHLDLFFPFIAQKKGLVVGPATDASLSLIASSASAGALLTDVSPWALVKMLLTGVFTFNAKTPAEFVAQMNDSRKYQTFPPAIIGQLSPVNQRFFKEHEIPTTRISNPGYYSRLLQDGQSWLSTQGRYDRIRRFFASGQIRLMHGSLVNGKTWQMINHQAHQSGTPVDILYWSNIDLDRLQNPDLLETNLRDALSPDAQVLRTTVSPQNWAYHSADFRLIAPILGISVLHGNLGRFMGFLQQFMSQYPHEQLAVSGFEDADQFESDEIIAEVRPENEIEIPSVETPLPAEVIFPVGPAILTGSLLPALVKG